jgi:3-oxoacyl-[acyl-carrier protein] reductase
MLLKDRTAIIYGGGGALGGAVAAAMASEGANVFLAGRTTAKLEEQANRIRAAGGVAEAVQLDALDSAAVERHADAVAEKTGSIDIAFNAIGVAHVQGVPLAELSLADYEYPVQVYTRTNFITSKAVAKHMVKRRSGVILCITTPASRMVGPGFLGHSVACAGVEALSRHLSGEVGASGVRVVCIRSHAIPEALGAGSHAKEVFGKVAADGAGSIDEMLAGAASGTVLKRLPTLADLGKTAVFLASDGAAAISGVIVNMSGMILD